MLNFLSFHWDASRDMLAIGKSGTISRMAGPVQAGPGRPISFPRYILSTYWLSESSGVFTSVAYVIVAKAFAQKGYGAKVVIKT